MEPATSVTFSACHQIASEGVAKIQHGWNCAAARFQFPQISWSSRSSQSHKPENPSQRAVSVERSRVESDRFKRYLARPRLTLTRSVSEERITPPRLHFGLVCRSDKGVSLDRARCRSRNRSTHRRASVRGPARMRMATRGTHRCTGCCDRESIIRAGDSQSLAGFQQST